MVGGWGVLKRMKSPHVYNESMGHLNQILHLNYDSETNLIENDESIRGGLIVTP